MVEAFYRCSWECPKRLRCCAYVGRFFFSFPEPKLCKPTGVSGSFWKVLATEAGRTLASHRSVAEPLSVSCMRGGGGGWLGDLQVEVWVRRRLLLAGVSQGQRVPMCSFKRRRRGRDSVEISTLCSSICGYG